MVVCILKIITIYIVHYKITKIYNIQCMFFQCKNVSYKLNINKVKHHFIVFVKCNINMNSCMCFPFCNSKLHLLPIDLLRNFKFNNINCHEEG